MECGRCLFLLKQKGEDMNLIYAAESIVKSRIDEYGFVMNTCVHDQASENLDKFLKALSSYQKAVSEYEVIQGLKTQINAENTQDEENLSKDEN